MATIRNTLAASLLSLLGLAYASGASEAKILHHLSIYEKRNAYTAYPPELIARWSDYVEKAEYQNAAPLSRAWQTVSSDNGITWSSPTPGIDSIHGGIQLQNGSLLVASYRDDGGNIGVHATPNPETHWKKIAFVECPEPETTRFGEPHILQLASGRVIMMIRATAKPYDDGSPLCHLWATYSDDNGKSWVPAYPTPLWGYPPHLLQLSDGRVLCSYGYRREPFGQRACVSDDGITWNVEDEVALRDDAANKDLGYPVSIELDPGRILTVYYQPNIPAGSTPATHPPHPNRKKPGILGTLWELPHRSN